MLLLVDINKKYMQQYLHLHFHGSLVLREKWTAFGKGDRFDRSTFIFISPLKLSIVA